MFNDTKFNKHGNEVLVPDPCCQEPILKQLSPSPVKASRARILIETFLNHSSSMHSGRGSTLWVLVEYCNIKGIKYCLTGTPNEGYIIELL